MRSIVEIEKKEIGFVELKLNRYYCLLGHSTAKYVFKYGGKIAGVIHPKGRYYEIYKNVLTYKESNNTYGGIADVDSVVYIRRAAYNEVQILKFGNV
jgi:hypothetical protein